MKPSPSFGPLVIDACPAPDPAARRTVAVVSPDVAVPIAAGPQPSDPHAAAMADLADAEADCNLDAAVRAVLRLRRLGYGVTLLPVADRGDRP